MPRLHPRHSLVNLLILGTEFKLPGHSLTIMLPVFYNKNDAYKRMVKVGIRVIYEAWIQVWTLTYTNCLTREVTFPF